MQSLNLILQYHLLSILKYSCKFNVFLPDFYFLKKKNSAAHRIGTFFA